MKHYDPADIANIKLLIMSEDSANVYIGVKMAKNVLGMTAKELKSLITINDVKPFITKHNYPAGYEIIAFGKRFFGANKEYSAYNTYCNESLPLIQKLLYDLD